MTAKSNGKSAQHGHCVTLRATAIVKVQPLQPGAACAEPYFMVGDPQLMVE